MNQSIKDLIGKVLAERQGLPVHNIVSTRGVVGIILNCTIVFNIKGILFGAVAIIVGVGVLQMSSLYDDGKDDF